VLSLLLVAGSADVRAAGQPSDEVEQLYVQGQDLFDAGDFAGAASAWSKALDGMPENEQSKTTRELLVIQTMTASRQAHAKTQDVQHLRNGQTVVDRYVASFKQAYGQDAVLSDSVQQARIELLTALQGAESQPQEWPEEEPTAAEPQPTQPPSPTPTVAPAELPPPTDRGADRGKKGTGLIATGSIFLALGAGAGGMLVAGLVIAGKAEDDFKSATTQNAREDADNRGMRSNTLAIAGVIAAPVCIGVGIGLLAAGVKRRKSSRMAVAPSVGPEFAGLVWSGRF
jgi:hypothetical protein